MKHICRYMILCSYYVYIVIIYVVMRVGKTVVSIYFAFLRIVVSKEYKRSMKGEREKRSFASYALKARVNERNESPHLSFWPLIFSSTHTNRLTRDPVVFYLTISFSLHTRLI